MLNLKSEFERVLRTATHDQDVAAELVKVAEAYYEVAEEVSTEKEIVKMSPSQQAALDAAKAKEELKK